MSDSSKDLLNMLNTLFDCQLKIASDINKSTTDLKLKELLTPYIKELEKNNKTKKDISNITYTHKVDLTTKVLKTFDISLFKTLIGLVDAYNINMYEDFYCYINYLIYNYEESSDTYDSFIPTLDSYYYFSENIYLHYVRYR